MVRWILLLFVVLTSLSLQRSLSQQQALNPPDQAPSQGRVPGSWIAPRPHISGLDDPAQHSMGLLIPDSIQRYWRTHRPNASYEAGVLPSSTDWSGFDSPVKAQGFCGACWAFAAVAAIENAGCQDDLSEQVLISCSNAGNCSGGYYENALNYVHASGLPPETSYPYGMTNGDCAEKSRTPAFLERIRSVTTTMWGEFAPLNSLRGALKNGPVLVRMVVFTDFDAYRGGIYHHATGSFKGFHAVLVEGYDDSTRCFKAKNSWGIGWGEGGYFRISYDDLNNEVEFGGYGAQVSGVYAEELTMDVKEWTGPIGFTLEQNYPNPFNPKTGIRFEVLGVSDVKIAVYDLLGREVAVLVNERKQAGTYEVSFDASGLASGVYIYRLTAGSFVQSKGMVLLK